MAADPETLFELDIEIGAGAYGRVYAGVDKATKKPVAVKVIPAVDLDTASLKHEVQVMRDFRSDFVVQCLGSYEREGALWIVMELCEPGSVIDVMGMLKRCLTEPEIAHVCAAVTLCLSMLHDRRLIHRDVKAGNVLMSRTGHIKLADFGVSAQLSTIHSKRDTVIGAPFWMAPEVINAESHDSKADVWSLGISLIEMAQGKPPHWEVHPMRVIFLIPTQPPPQLTEKEKWSAPFHDFLAKCLVKDPNQRASAKELLSHPFIKSHVAELQAKKPPSSVLTSLVDASLPLMQDFRIARAQEREAAGGTLASGTLTRDGTLQLGATTSSKEG